MLVDVRESDDYAREYVPDARHHLLSDNALQTREDKALLRAADRSLRCFAAVCRICE